MIRFIIVAGQEYRVERSVHTHGHLAIDKMVLMPTITGNKVLVGVQPSIQERRKVLTALGVPAGHGEGE